MRVKQPTSPEFRTRVALPRRASTPCPQCGCRPTGPPDAPCAVYHTRQHAHGPGVVNADDALQARVLHGSAAAVPEALPAAQTSHRGLPAGAQPDVSAAHGTPARLPQTPDTGAPPAALGRAEDDRAGTGDRPAHSADRNGTGAARTPRAATGRPATVAGACRGPSARRDTIPETPLTTHLP